MYPIAAQGEINLMSPLRSFIGGICLGLCCVAPSWAEQATPQKGPQSFHSLISSGYKIISASYVPVTPDIANYIKNSAFLVTLQNNNAVAVCVFSLHDWEYFANSKALDDPAACDFRSF
jgi:hypothetical protein